MALDFAPNKAGGNRWNFKNYWLHGPGLARWSGWTELYNQVKRFVADDYARRIAAQWYFERFGKWPGSKESRQKGAKARRRRGRTAAAVMEEPMTDADADWDDFVLPPADWFADPQLPKGAGPSISSEGRYTARVGEFDVPHIGLEDGTTMPRSRSSYRFFKTGGGVLTADGTVVPTGRITLGTGHAGLSEGVTAAAEHYDNTGTAVADVAIGEDEHGVWVSGVVRPGTTPEQVHALRASPLSGDWRDIDGSYELVAALAVNTPGFPIVTPSDLPALAASGRRPALVAVGIVQNEPPSGEQEAPVPDDNPTPPDDGLAAIREKLGLAADADQAAILAALDTAKAPAPKLPDGVVTIEAAQLETLTAAAQRGDAARAQQEQEGRQALVASAIKDGRIPPARQEHWLAQLQADPGAAVILASLQPGLVPVSPIGHAVDPTSGDDPDQLIQSGRDLYATRHGKTA